MAGIVAKSYCDALFSLAEEDNKLALFKEQLEVVKDTLKANAQYRALMSHPKINREQKKEMLEAVYGEKIDHTLLNFLKLLIDKSRFQAIEDITKEYIKAFNNVNNIQVVYVKSAKALNDEEVLKLKKTLEEKLQKKVDFVLQVDQDLIAGIRIKINDSIIDNSAKGRLDRLKTTVLKES